MAGKGHQKAHATKSRKITKYGDWARANLDIVSEWAAEGLTLSQMAHAMKVHPQTVRKWFDKHAEFRLAITDGRRLACQDVESSLIRRAMGYDTDQVEETEITNAEGEIVQTIRKKTVKHVPPDVKAAEFFLKNQDPERWSKSSNDVNVTGGVLLIPQKPDADWAESVKQHQQQLQQNADAKIAEVLSDGTEDEED